METTIALVSPKTNESGLEKAIQPALDKFMEASPEVIKIQDKCLAIAISDESTLTMAVQTLSEAGQYYKKLKEAKEVIKKPITATGKKVEAVTKVLMDPLEAAIESGKEKVLKYNNEQHALKLKEQQRILDIKNLISNIDLQLRQKIAGCTTADQAKALQVSIKEKFPPMATFAEFTELAMEVLTRNNNSVMERMSFLEQSALLNTAQKELAAQKEAERIQSEALKSNEMTMSLEAQAGAEQAVIMAPAVSNIRKTWAFELENIHQVPREWLMLDEAKVSEWFKANKESLTDGMVLNGVKFYKKQSLINR